MATKQPAQPTDEQFRDAMFEMFGTQGWRYFVQELISNYQAMDTLNSCNDEKGLFINKGQLIALANIINLEDIMRDADDEAEDEAEADTVH